MNPLNDDLALCDLKLAAQESGTEWGVKAQLLLEIELQLPRIGGRAADALGRMADALDGQLDNARPSELEAARKDVLRYNALLNARKTERAALSAHRCDFDNSVNAYNDLLVSLRPQ